MNLKIHHTTYIHPTAVIFDNVTIGENSYIGPFCIIGAEPESIKHDGPGKGVFIGSGVKLTGHVTIDSGIDSRTVINAGCLLMKQTHVGHDAQLMNGVIMAPGARIGGYAFIDQFANIGMNAVVHQRQSVGKGVMLGAGSVVVRGQDLEDLGTYVGAPARRVGDNVKGKERCK